MAKDCDDTTGLGEVMTERLLFPFGVYDTNRCAMCWIGLYENEDDCWTNFLGWPSKEEIDYAQSQGLTVLPLTVNYEPPKTEHAPVRLIAHEHFDQSGSYEVRFTDGRPSVFFYYDDVAGRRLRPEQVDKATAIEAAKTFARAEREKLTQQITKPETT